MPVFVQSKALSTYAHKLTRRIPHNSHLHFQGLSRPDLLVFLHNIRHRSNGRNPVRVDLRVALCVMLLDMLKVRRPTEGGDIPVQVPQPAMDGRVTGADVAYVALEVLNVDGVETHDGGVETDVGFGYGVAKEVDARGVGRIVFLAEISFNTIERGEKGFDGLFVGFLSPRIGVSTFDIDGGT